MSQNQFNELAAKADVELQAGNLHEAITLYERAIDAINVDDRAEVATARDTFFKRFAPFAMQVGDFEALKRGLTMVRQNIALYEEMGLTEELGKARNNLGVVLFQVATSVPGAEGRALADQGVAALEAAATTRTLEKSPLDFAQTQSNLAVALQAHPDVASRDKAGEILDRVIAAHENALSVYTMEAHPGPWAPAQTNLGSALAERGLRSPADEAVDLYKRSMNGRCYI